MSAAAVTARADEASLRYGPAPPWVKPAPPETRQAPSAGAPVQLLLQDMQAKLGPDGDSNYAQTRFKILTPEALAAGNLQFVWDPQVDTMTVHHLTVTHDGKTVDVLAGQKFTVVRREQGLEAAMLDGRLTATLQVPGLQVGDIVDFARTVEHHDPILAGHSQYIESLPLTQIEGRVRLRATWPAAANITWRTSDDLPKAPVRRAGTMQEVEFEADGMAPSVGTDGAPARYRVRRLFQASGFAAWRDISTMMAPLYAQAATLKPDSPLKAEAAKIKAAAPDAAHRALLALQLVQDQTRYVYVGLDSGAYRPAAADETWTRRWGDCKAKTALLLSLLGELGIKAEPTLANAYGMESLDGMLPQLAAFNHVLVHATVDGKDLWLDGTRSGDTNLTELEQFPYGVTLPLRVAGADPQRLIPPPMAHPTGVTVIQIDASAGLRAAAKVAVHMTLRGDAAFATDRATSSQPHDQIERQLRTSITNAMPWLEPSSITWKYEARRRIFTEEVQGVGKVDWSKDVGGARTLWFEMTGSGFGKFKPIKRDAAQDQTAPFLVSYPGYSRSVTTFRLPAGVQFGRRGDNVSTTFAGIRYVRRMATVGDTVVMYRSARSMKPEITAAEAAADEARRPDLQPGAGWVWAMEPAADSKPSGATAGANAPLAPAKAPETEKTLLAAAYNDARDGSYDKAMVEVDKALAIKPGWVDALRARGFVYYSQGRYSDAADAFGATIKASTTPDEGLWLARLTDLGLAGRLDEAVQVGDAALAAFPKSVRVRADRALNYSRRREYDKALAEIDEALRLPNEDPSLPAEKAGILWAMDRHDEAMRFIEAAVADDPDNVQALAVRGMFEVRLKRFGPGQDDLEEAWEMNPADQGGLARLADLDAKRGDFAAAIARLDGGLARWPTSAVLLNSRCWIRALSADKLDLAAKDCDAAIARNPSFAAAIDSRAFVSFRQKRYPDAVERYGAALKIRPDNADSLYGRGLAKLRAGDRPGGEADLAQAVRLDPHVAETYADIGLRP